MPNLAHRQSQELSLKAAELMTAGSVDEARSLFFQAAALEAEALEQVETGKARTRGILNVSLVSQYYKAQAYQQAKTAAYQALARSDLPDFAQEQLQELLGVIWEEEGLKSRELQSSGETIMVSLRGSGIGTGRAPAGIAMNQMVGLNSLLYRITEWLSGSPLRKQGAPQQSIRDLCQPWISQPQSGSYRFGISLIENVQLPLFDRATVTAREITEGLLKIVNAVSPPEIQSSHRENISLIVPNTEYRQAMLKLLRNIVPDGRRLTEVELTLISDREPERAALYYGSKRSIDRVLWSDYPNEPPEDQISGVLRALHLDRNWVEIATDDDPHLRCQIEHAVLDDVLGPMVNQRVLVSGRWENATKQSRFRLFDIELDSSNSAEHVPPHPPA
jgi:hypothetical protein